MLKIEKFNIRQVLIDNSSLVNIMYLFPIDENR